MTESLGQAKARAQVNADYFGRPYYVIIPASSGTGYYVERDKPADGRLVWYVAKPNKGQS